MSLGYCLIKKCSRRFIGNYINFSIIDRFINDKLKYHFNHSLNCKFTHGVDVNRMIIFKNNLIVNVLKIIGTIRLINCTVKLDWATNSRKLCAHAGC